MAISKLLSLAVSMFVILSIFTFMPHGHSASLREGEYDNSLHFIPVENYGYAPMLRYLIDAAKNSIYISMNVISDYQPVKTLLDSLISAKNRGVDVRVLYEGEITSNHYAVSYLRNGGVSVKNDSSKIFLHTKMVVIDGDIVYIGSHNWSTYALERNNEYGIIIFNGTIGSYFSQYFNALWLDANLTPANGELSLSDGKTTMRCTYDGYTYSALMDLLKSAKSRLLVAMYTMNYYSDPQGEEYRVDNLVDEIVAKLGIAKVILDNHDSGNAYDYLENEGVDVMYDSSSTITHLKMVIADDSVYIGDANWDTEYLDNETHTVGVIIHNVSVANFFTGYFNTIQKYGDAPYYIPDGFVDRWDYSATPGDELSINLHIANGGVKNNTTFHLVPHGDFQFTLNENPSWNRTDVYSWYNESMLVDVPADSNGTQVISLTFYSLYYHINYTMFFVIHISGNIPELNYTPLFAPLILLISTLFTRKKHPDCKERGYE